ncbi:hypothetical protein ACHQM5_005770 [Ranunculus cassubicifolius]
MARTMNMFFGFLLVAIALIHSVSAQTTHVVGGSAGWTVPSPATLYSDWASTQTFTVGDSLTFNFASGTHAVATVTQAAYDACDGTSPIGAIQMTGPVTIRLTSPGRQYYFCTFQGHCSSGQKLSINVVAAAASPPPTTASPPPRTATPPPTSASPPTPSTVSPPIATPPSTSDIPPTTSTVPPPLPNSASQLAVVSFSATFLLAAAALLF